MPEREKKPVPSIDELLEQLSFLEVAHTLKKRVSEEQQQKMIDAALASVELMHQANFLTGQPMPEPPDTPTSLKQQFLASVQHFQELIIRCAPYLALAEEALTESDGVNALLENGIDSFFLVLRQYIDIFQVKVIPEQLPDEERERFLSFLSLFMENLDKFQPGECIEQNMDRVAAVLDGMIRNGQMNSLMDPSERREYIQTSPRTLPTLTRSHKAYMPVSKVSRMQILAALEPLSVDVGGGAQVESQIWFSEGVTLNEFDVEIQNTIGEMVQHNQDRALTATPAQIFRECAALMDKEKVSPDMESMVISSIDKMLLARATIDYGEQIKKHKRLKRQPGYDYETIRIEGHLIEGRKLTVNAGGHQKTAYRFYDKPMYYAYSHAIGQIAALDKKLLNTSQSGDIQKTRKNTRDFVVLKRTLAREVERMKREAIKSGGVYEQRLSYTHIQEEVGLMDATDKQQRTLRADIDYLCELWVSLGYIRSFEKYKASKAFAGIIIML